MSVSVMWDNDIHTALRYDFVGDWNWQEFITVYQQADRMFKSVGHLVDVIADFQQSGCVPVETLVRLAYIFYGRPENLGNSILVGDQTFTTTSFAVFGQFYGEAARTFQLVHSLDRARALLTKAPLTYPLPGNIKTA